MNTLENKIQEQFGVDNIIHDPFNVYSFLFEVKFNPYFGVVLEVEKAPEVDCYLLTHSGHFIGIDEVATVDCVRYTINTESEVLDKIKEVLEEYNKISDLLNNLFGTVMLYGLVDKYVVTDIPIDVWIDMSRELFPYTHVPPSRIVVGKNLDELDKYLKKMGLKHYRINVPNDLDGNGYVYVYFGNLDYSIRNYTYQEFFNLFSEKILHAYVALLNTKKGVENIAYPYIDQINGKDVLLGLLKTKIGKVDAEEDTASEFLLSVIEEYENSSNSEDSDYCWSNDTLRLYNDLKCLYREMTQSSGLTKVLFELGFSGFNDFLEFAFEEYFSKI